MADKKTWIVAQVRDRFYAFEPEGRGIYDPHDLRQMTCRFHPRQRFTESEAKRLVDKMNRKGPAVEVSNQ